LSQNHRSEFDRAAFNASPDYGGEGFYNEMADFARAARERRPALYDWEEGLRVQEVVDALYRSAEAREPVEVRQVSGAAKTS
jgi:predicted dehydrogenase